MRDRLAARHLPLCPLNVDVDPLMIAGGLGELVDRCLIDQHPFAAADLLADMGLHVGRFLDFEHGAFPVRGGSIMPGPAGLVATWNSVLSLCDGGKPMDHVKMSQRQAAFRADFRTRIAPAYFGWAHVVLIYALGFAAIWYCARQIVAPAWYE